MTDLDGKPARAITEAEWAEVRRAGLLAGVQLASQVVPDVLLAYQKRGIETTARSAVTVWEKSRRIGATWGIAADAVLTAAAARGAGGMDALYIGYNLDMAREFVDVAAMWARAFSSAATAAGVEEFVFRDGEDNAIQAFRVRFASGYELTALASRPRSLRGRQGFVIVDEAAFHDDLDALLQAALALLIWGGKVLVISTHLGEDNPFARLVQDVRAARRPFALVRTTFDDALHDGLYQRICLVRGDVWSPEAEAAWRAGVIAFYGDGADEELFCVPSRGGGVYLSRALIEARMVPDLPVCRLERPASFSGLPKDVREADIDAWCEEHLQAPLKALDPALMHAFGQDFGRVSDLSVIAPIAIGKTLRRRVPFVVEMRNIPFEQQRQVLFFIGDRLPRFLGGQMDATGNGAYLAEVAAQRYGLHRVLQVKLNAPWYLEHFPPLKAAFEDAMIALPADDELLADLALVKTIAGIPRLPAVRTVTAEGKKRHGDFAVALVLAYAATRMNVAEYGYEPARDDAPADPDDERFDAWRGRPRETGDLLFGARAGRLW